MSLYVAAATGLLVEPLTNIWTVTIPYLMRYSSLTWTEAGLMTVSDLRTLADGIGRIIEQENGPDS
jgi:hypothetical protein